MSSGRWLKGGNMNFVKIKVKYKKIKKPMDYGWMMKLSSLVDVMEYAAKYDATRSRVWEDISSLVKMAKNEPLWGDHIRNADSLAVYHRAEARGAGIVQTLAELLSEKHMNMLQSLPVYVNKNGGYFYRDKDVIEYDSTESDIWPEDKDREPEFKKWPGGRHWYCKIGGVDVVVDNQQKWNTLAGAKAAYEKFIKEQKK